ncbi:MAG: zinc-binding dehydrogenase [Deltaproteobacteria bacterium]|nr:zinc-binding dehydrogenase [Deltaproteobacteria bacterium]
MLSSAACGRERHEAEGKEEAGGGLGDNGDGGCSFGSGRLNVRIGATFALREAADAHRTLEGRKTTGKVLLLP